MMVYLDDDSAATALVRLLQRDGHHVLIPSDFGLTGAKDPVHLRQAIREHAAFLTQNFDDFKNLHDLLAEGQGHHFGILVVRKDNDPSRDLKPTGIARAVRNLIAAAVSIADQYIVLNHWR